MPDELEFLKCAVCYNVRPFCGIAVSLGFQTQQGEPADSFICADCTWRIVRTIGDPVNLEGN